MAVDFEHEAGIGYIILNRPPANSYDYAFMDELGRAVAAAADHPDVKVVIVRSALDRFFSAGADVKAFSENAPERNMDMIRLAHHVLGRIARIPKVFIAQIAGHAVGGGLEI
ncbi:MAG TPA: enoyl-CoA hydratase/isomerase family protein, partial [Dehalococcoidia bacterium]|nr:enoyl-CoA hydratase/isomerase family protein [Dehalococcoidia bacterium]